MVVTPWKRLSDEVLSKAIQKFYRDENLLPPGVPLESIQGWASRMAFGLRLCTQRFRKVYAESPVGAKSKEVAALKARLTKLGAYEAAPPDLQLSQEGMDTLFAPESLQRIRKYLNDKRTTQPSAAGQGGDAAAAVEAKQDKDGAAAGPRRPVASVARSHRLPPLLLEALKKQPEAPKPFATDGTEVEADEAEDAESAGREAAAQSSKSKDASKPGPKKAVKPKAVKAKKTPVTTAEEERLLDAPADAALPLPLPAALAPAEPVPKAAVVYEAGAFKDKKKAFIKRKREETGMSYKDAQQCWMLCSERAALVGSLSFAEQKKRRFI